jgi:hypothetical protein
MTKKTYDINDHRKMSSTQSERVKDLQDKGWSISYWELTSVILHHPDHSTQYKAIPR